MKLIFVKIIFLLFFLQACGDTKNVTQDIKRHLKAAEGYYEQGQLRAAVVEAKTAIELNANKDDAYLLLAKIYNDIGSYQESSEFIEARINKFPALIHELIKAYYYRNKLVSILNYAQRFELDNVDQAIQLKTHKYIALAALQLGETSSYENSIAYIQRINAAAPELDFLEAYRLTLDDQLEASEKILAGLIKHHFDFDAVILLALLKIDQNLLPEAEKLLTSLLLSFPSTDVVTAQRLRTLTLMVDVLIGQRRTSEALIYQRLIASANPEAFFARQEIQQASSLYATGHYQEARIVLEKIAEKFPTNTQIKSMLAMVDFRLGNEQALLDLFLDDYDPEATLSSIVQAAAVAKFRAQQADEAIDLLMQAVTAKPNNSRLLTSLGLAELSIDSESKKGAERIEKSLMLDANQPRAKLSLAQYYRLQGKTEAARRQLVEAYEFSPLDPYIIQQYFQFEFEENKDKFFVMIKGLVETKGNASYEEFFQAWYWYLDKQLDKAAAGYQQALPRSKGAIKSLLLAGLARVEMDQGKKEQAIGHFEQLILHDTQAIAPYVEWFKAISEIQDWSRARSFIQSLENSQDNWVRYLILAEVELAENNVDAAITAVEASLAINPQAQMAQSKAFSLYALKANVAEVRNDLIEARKFYVRAISLFPKNVDVLIRLINIEISENKFDEAHNIIDVYVGEEERFVKHYLTAIILFAKNEPEAGLKELRLSWSEQPTELVADAIYLYFDSRDHKAFAEKFLQEWIEKLPNSVRAYIYQASVAERVNNIEAAVILYDKVIEIDPTNVVAYNNLANLYIDKNVDIALDYANRAYQLAPTSAAVLDTLGWVLVKSGAPEKGIAYIEQALTLEPTNTVFAEHLEFANKAINP